MIVTALVSTCVETIVIVTSATESATKFPSLSEKPDPEEQHSSTPDSGPTLQQKGPPPQVVIGLKALVLPYNSSISLWRPRFWSLNV